MEGFRVLNWKYVDYLQDSFGVWPNLYIMGAYKIGVLYRSQDQTDGAYQFKQVRGNTLHLAIISLNPLYAQGSRL